MKTRYISARLTIILVGITFLYLTQTVCANTTIQRTFDILDKSQTPAPKKKKAKTIKVSSPKEIIKINKENQSYEILQDIILFDTLWVPKGVELYFNGGSMSGVIVFDDTYLSGKVRFVNSHLLGNIVNKTYYTGWSCYGDGLHDDAPYINDAIEICTLLSTKNI